MVSLTCMNEGGALATKGPRPEKLVFEAGRFVRGILEEFVLLRPGSEIEEPHGALLSLPWGSLFQSQKISHFDWGRLAPTSKVV